MADMNRRNFLFGTVAAAAGGTALVLAAPERAVQLFQPTLQETIAVSRVSPTLPVSNLDHMDWRYDPVSPGDTLFNGKGEPICIVNSLTVDSAPDMLETTAFGDAHQLLKRGLIRVHMEVSPIFNPAEIRRRRA